MNAAVHQPPSPPLRRRRRDGHWLWAVGLAAVGQVLLVGLMLLMSTWSAGARPIKPPRQPVSLRALDSRAWERNRGALARFAPASPRPPTPYPMMPGQVVDVAPGNGQVDPEAKYLAETNNHVRKQTQADRQQAIYSRAAPKTLASTQAPAATPAKGNHHTVAETSAVGHVDRFLGDFGARPRLLQMLQPASAATEAPADDAPDKEGLPDGEGDGDSNQRSLDSPAQVAGGAAPNDDLAGVEKGDSTFLNTREFRYAGFFNRVKQAVSAHWDPDGQLRSRDPRGLRFGTVERITVLNVTLRPDGSLQDIFVAQGSGIDFLDVEAIQAFERAQPFPNPPQGMVQDGAVRFGFAFKITNDWRLPPQMMHLPRR